MHKAVSETSREDGRNVVFSIIVPTHNRADILTRALNSALNQTYQDFELLVIDDDSTDNTRDVVAPFMSDSRIRYWKLEKNSGVSTARNMGIAMSSGEFVAFLDDDDEFLPEFLAEIESEFDARGSDTGFVWTWRQEVHKSDSGEHTVHKQGLSVQGTTPSTRRTRLFRTLDLGTGGLVIRKTALEQVGLLDVEFTTAEDTDLLIRLASVYDFSVVPKPLYRVHVGTRDSLKQDPARRTMFSKLIEKHKDRLSSLSPDALAVLYRVTGRINYAAGDYATARRMIVQSIRTKPFSVKSWMQLFLAELLRLLPLSVRQSFFGR